MAGLPEPNLDETERADFARGVSEFNAGRFFECHDLLEEVWRGVRGPGRGFLQGLIQVAVAFHHLTRGNRGGATSVLDRALARLAPYPASYLGLDLDAHRAELRRWQESLRTGAPAPEAPPHWQFAGPPA